MVRQVREVLHRSVDVNTALSLVWSTLEPVKGMFFVESMHQLVFPPRFLCTKNQVTNKDRINETRPESRPFPCASRRDTSPSPNA